MSNVHSLCDYEPEVESFRDEALSGLQRDQKKIPPKFFYDERGSKLFDQICELDEYYPTRTEMAIMREQVGKMARVIGKDVLLVEYGSGSSLKTRILLDHLDRLAAYVPIDISREHLMKAARELAADYPDLPIIPVCADYTSSFEVPTPNGEVRRVVGYFPGSTIGNFEQDDARAFLRQIAQQIHPDGGLLIGVDLHKDPEIIEAAYNDEEGVTAAFNKNLLRRMNRELDATFDLDQFRHRAVYNADRQRIEMYLVSTSDQQVEVAGETIPFEKGETICTEYSHKYTLDSFAEMAASAGLSVERVWTDEDDLFSVQYCAPAQQT